MFPGDVQILKAALLEKCCQPEIRESKGAGSSLCPLSQTVFWHGGKINARNAPRGQILPSALLL